jgi:AcrR family transcriptional regulator
MPEAYKSSRTAALRRVPTPGTPAQQRDLRAQGRKTMRRLLDAGSRVFAERGFHAARVDDIVRAARTSHGTFYLYFSNKEDLLRALAVECAHEMGALAGGLGAITADAAGEQELRQFLGAFLATYRRHGPVIRAWMEGNVDDREVTALGIRAFTNIASELAQRMRDAGTPGNDADIAALMAMLERLAYFLVSRRIDFDSDRLLDSVTVVVHRGFFAADAAGQLDAGAAAGSELRIDR